MARILVIDDEPLVAMMIERTLQGAHEVTVEHSARAVLERHEKGERWDAVLADLNLPDGDAIGLRDQLARTEPSLPARLLVLTGGATTEEARAFLASPGVRWLQKPFRSAELLAAVEQILASTR